MRLNVVLGARAEGARREAVRECVRAVFNVAASSTGNSCKSRSLACI